MTSKYQNLAPATCPPIEPPRRILRHDLLMTVAFSLMILCTPGTASADPDEPPEGALAYYVDQQGTISVTYGPGYRPEERALVPEDELIPLSSEDGKVMLMVSPDVYDLILKGGAVDYVMVVKSPDGTETAIRRYHCHGGFCHSH